MRYPLLILCCLAGAACRHEVPIPSSRGEAMQVLATEMKDYAAKRNPDFIMVVQNAPGLGVQQFGEDAGILQRFLEAMDAFTAESLFFLERDDQKIADLEQLDSSHVVIVLDQMPDDDLQPSISLTDARGWIACPRSPENKDYTKIPPIWNVNNVPVTQLSDAKNFLCLIGDGEFATKQEMMYAIDTTNFDLVELDLFAKDGEPYDSTDLAALKVKANGAPRLVLAYVNVGAAEYNRYYCGEDGKDCKRPRPTWFDCQYDDFCGEFWVKYWQPGWKRILYSGEEPYLKRVLDAGFDGIVMDNMEAYIDPCNIYEHKRCPRK
jgi:cysteinyl-tRNA synthetase